jgi:hypothetical protein
MSQQNRNIKIALMIGHINVGLGGVYVVQPVDPDPDAADKQDAPGPNSSNDMDRVSGTGKK